MNLRRRLVIALARLERRAKLRRLIVLAAALALPASVLAVASAVAFAAEGFRSPLSRVLLAVAVLAVASAAVPLVAAVLLALRQQARMALDLKATRIDLARLSSADSSASAQAARPAAQDLLTAVRDLGAGVQHSHETLLAQHREMLTAVLEQVLEVGSTLDRQHGELLQTVERSAERARALGYRQVEALLSIVSVLSLRHPLPRLGDWAVSPDAAASVVGLVLERRPKLVLECGSGVSTVLAAYALERVGAGRLVALEHDPVYAARTQADLRAHGLQDVARVVLAPLVSTEVGDSTYNWYDTSGLTTDEPVDLLFVDGPPSRTGVMARYPAMPLLRSRLADDALVVLDDAGRPDERRIVERWSQEEPGLSVTWLEHERGTAVLARRP